MSSPLNLLNEMMGDRVTLLCHLHAFVSDGVACAKLCCSSVIGQLVLAAASIAALVVHGERAFAC